MNSRRRASSSTTSTSGPLRLRRPGPERRRTPRGRAAEPPMAARRVEGGHPALIRPLADRRLRDAEERRRLARASASRARRPARSARRPVVDSSSTLESTQSFAFLEVVLGRRNRDGDGVLGDGNERERMQRPDERLRPARLRVVVQRLAEADPDDERDDEREDDDEQRPRPAAAPARRPASAVTAVTARSRRRGASRGRTPRRQSSRRRPANLVGERLVDRLERPAVGAAVRGGELLEREDLPDPARRARRSRPRPAR